MKSNILQDPKTSEGAFEDKLFKVKSIKTYKHELEDPNEPRNSIARNTDQDLGI